VQSRPDWGDLFPLRPLRIDHCRTWCLPYQRMNLFFLPECSHLGVAVLPLAAACLRNLRPLQSVCRANWRAEDIPGCGRCGIRSEHPCVQFLGISAGGAWARGAFCFVEGNIALPLPNIAWCWWLFGNSSGALPAALNATTPYQAVASLICTGNGTTHVTSVLLYAVLWSDLRKRESVLWCAPCGLAKL